MESTNANVYYSNRNVNRLFSMSQRRRLDGVAFVTAFSHRKRKKMPSIFHHRTHRHRQDGRRTQIKRGFYRHSHNLQHYRTQFMWKTWLLYQHNAHGEASKSDQGDDSGVAIAANSVERVLKCNRIFIFNAISAVLIIMGKIKSIWMNVCNKRTLAKAEATPIHRQCFCLCFVISSARAIGACTSSMVTLFWRWFTHFNYTKQ